MHEYAVTKSMIEIAIDEAQKANACKITDIRLVIGDLSTIIDESVQMYFDIMSEETIAQGAKLHFRRVSAEFKCPSCGLVFKKPDKGFDCPTCSSLGLSTGAGKEFYIESIEVD